MFVVLQVIGGGLVELVSMMERDLGYSMDTLYELCESWLWWRIRVELFGEQKDVRGESYMKLVEVKERHVFASGENISSCLLLTRMCGVCLEFHRNQFKTEVLLNFFSS